MKHIDERQLEADVEYRFGYVSEFIGFGQSDIDAIHGAADRLAPLVPGLVDAVYDKLFGYDATKRHFMPRQSGYDGPVPDDIESLAQDHEMIAFRKQHLAGYLTALVARKYDAKLVSYLDMVGKMHTPAAGSPRLHVPLVQTNALMGFVSDGLTNAIFGLALDRATEARTVRAFNKLLWLQNDLIVRHYAASSTRAAAS